MDTAPGLSGLAFAGLVIATASVSTALCARVATRNILAQTRLLENSDSVEAAAQINAARIFGAFARPTITTTLAMLDRTFPPELHPASLERTARGRLRMQIDTPDPDRLRVELRAARIIPTFQERGQEAHDDGIFRVTLEQGADPP